MFGWFGEFYRVASWTFCTCWDHCRHLTCHFAWFLSDSSLQSYCGVLYLQIFASVDVRVYFLAAKAKVAPLKELSIARLELLGCVLLIDLIDQVKCAVNDRVMLTDVKCWSDSEIVLCWVKGKSEDGNRGLKIVSLR